MGFFEEFIISLEDNRDDFEPGEFVNGFVVLRLSESMNIKRIFVKMRGQAKVSWTENQGGANGCLYTNKCDYACCEKTLVEGAQGSSIHLLPQGNHLLPFSFQVPMSALSSFEGTHGRIYYWLKAGITRPSQPDVTTKLTFSVTQRNDLGENPKLKGNVLSKEELQTGCCKCLFQKSLTVKAKLDRSWFNRGSEVLVSLTIENGLNRNLKDISVHLVQELLYIAKTGKVKSERNVIETVTVDGVRGRETKQFDQTHFDIPWNLPPSMRHCPCINIDYNIQIYVKHSRTYHEMGTLPFIVATPPRPPHRRLNNRASWPIVVHAPLNGNSPGRSPWGTPKPSPRMSPRLTPRVSPRVSPKASARNSPRLSPRTSPSVTPRASPKSSPCLSGRGRWPTPRGSPVLSSRSSLLKLEVLPAVDNHFSTSGSHLDLLPRKSF